MRKELDDLYVPPAGDFVPDDELLVVQPRKHLVHLLFGHGPAIRKNDGTEAKRTILEPPFPIALTPKALEQNGEQRVRATEDLVLEEAGL